MVLEADNESRQRFKYLKGNLFIIAFILINSFSLLTQVVFSLDDTKYSKISNDNLLSNCPESDLIYKSFLKLKEKFINIDLESGSEILNYNQKYFELKSELKKNQNDNFCYRKLSLSLEEISLTKRSSLDLITIFSYLKNKSSIIKSDLKNKNLIVEEIKFLEIKLEAYENLSQKILLLLENKSKIEELKIYRNFYLNYLIVKEKYKDEYFLFKKNNLNFKRRNQENIDIKLEPKSESKPELKTKSELKTKDDFKIELKTKLKPESKPELKTKSENKNQVSDIKILSFFSKIFNIFKF